MKLDFLGASDSVSLTKSFTELVPGQYLVDPYPLVSRFVSVSSEVNSPEDFFSTTQVAAESGFCLLKGNLKHKLQDESRAGQTDAHAPTNWLCLDIDIALDISPREFLESLDPGFKDVSFIAQASSSCGIKSDKAKWRGHIFVLLQNQLSPQVLKHWLISKNLELPELLNNIRLSSGGFALRYPLDTTTCQNDKLIYISPPVCINFEDPIAEQRFVLNTGSKPKAEFYPKVNAAAVVKQTNELIKQLRSTAGYEVRKAKYTVHNSGVDILKTPDPVTVTGKKEARGFVYLNLDGGDSWAYYFPIDNPELLHNFKGEPAMYLRDVDLDIWQEYNKPSAVIEPESAQGARFQPFVCRNAPRDCYYNGIYRHDTQTVELYTAASKERLSDFLAQYGIGMEDFVVDWTIEFNPTIQEVFDSDKRWVNTFKPTHYMKQAANSEATTIPTVIDCIIVSLCGTPEVKQHFINWLAAAFQTRTKLGTAWIFQGIQGTGKGLLYSKILSPLFGRDQTHELTMDRFDDQFNSYLEKNLLLFIDEANVQDTKNGDRTVNKLKHLITEDDIIVRAMRTNPITARNYSNLVFASNQTDIIPLEQSDRRFNVAPRQENSLVISPEEVELIEQELPIFADYLNNYQVDLAQARKIILTEARENLIRAGSTTVESFFHSILKGDLGYFTQFLRDRPPSDSSGILYLDYESTLKNWIHGANQPRNLSRDELQKAYNYLQLVNTQMSPTKFSRMCAKYGLNIKPIRTDAGLLRGLKDHVWKLSEEDREDLLANDPADNKITPIRKSG